MFKKFFIFVVFLFFASCGKDVTPENISNEKVEISSGKIISSENENIKETLKNGLKINKLTLNIINNVCENLEGKINYVLEGEEKIPGKIEVVAFIEDYIKEDKKEYYNDFVSLKKGEIKGIYEKFKNINNLENIYNDFDNKEEFFFYLSNYMIFLNKDEYLSYSEKYLSLLEQTKEELKETPFIGIVLSEFHHNKSCSNFIENKFFK